MQVWLPQKLFGMKVKRFKEQGGGLDSLRAGRWV